MVENRLLASGGSKLTMLRNKASGIILDVFTYSTVRSATIQSYRVGIVYRLAQLVLLSYIIGLFGPLDVFLKKTYIYIYIVVVSCIYSFNLRKGGS